MERKKETAKILDVRVVFDRHTSKKIYKDMEINHRRATQQIQYIVDQFYQHQSEE